MASQAYQDALRQRLGAIADIGNEQTTWERIANARRRADEERNAQLDWQQQQIDIARQRQANIDSMYTSPLKQVGQAAFGAARSGFEDFANSIARKESGGNYGAVNRSSGALGKYQIMPSNIRGSGRGWDYEALGRDVSTSQFLASPEIQEKIARYKLQQYYNKYGPAGASIAWYAGPGAANRYATTGQVSRAAQGSFPSVASYMNSILGSLF